MRKAGPLVVIALLVGCGGTTDLPDVQASACPDAAASTRDTDGGASTHDAIVATSEAGQESDALEPANDAAPIDVAAEASEATSGDAVRPDAARSNDGSKGGPHDAAAPGHCDNSIQDFDETDVDCGGSCPGCWLAQHCVRSLDCSPIAPGCNTKLGGCACDAVSKICVADVCVDHRKDGDESDVDCGGMVCPACDTGAICTSNRDCKKSSCDALTATCDADACADHQRDGNETDVDCGGGICPLCPLGMGCALNYDCTSGACDAVSRKCVTDPCFDHRWDGTETDTDCGGSVCAARCKIGSRCTTTADCESGHVCTIYKVCQ
jgi:hypothetical protein